MDPNCTSKHACKISSFLRTSGCGAFKAFLPAEPVTERCGTLGGARVAYIASSGAAEHQTRCEAPRSHGTAPREVPESEPSARVDYTALHRMLIKSVEQKIDRAIWLSRCGGAGRRTRRDYPPLLWPLRDVGDERALHR